ncbi:CBS domain-containing protein [Streptomyces sp. NPDC093591]|uniref:CBS domain-containing protein n=1 Tax=Streptomyces sp. NPDC093591 TaxID=3366044 RepID=UPI00381A31AB
MRARDLAQAYITIDKEAEALEAVGVLVEHDLPGLLVVDSAGQPYAAVPACDLIRALVPGYIREDPVLAEVIDEQHADHLCQAVAGRKLVDCLPVGRPLLPTAAPDCTAMELAELMARTRSPLIAVIEQGATGQGRLLGVITAAHLLRQLLHR